MLADLIAAYALLDSPPPPPPVSYAGLEFALPEPKTVTNWSQFPKQTFKSPITPVPPPASTPARYWINLTDQPGIQVYGRIENGVATDVTARRRTFYPAPASYWIQPQYYGGSVCGPGGCR